MPAPVAVACSVGVMAYNEEANIARLIEALLAQQGPTCHIREIIVLASGCTDRTEEIVRGYEAREPKVKLLSQARREGKASAVNVFLAVAQSDILVLESADTIPAPGAIARLLAPFADPNVGMTGCRPVPVNDRTSFMGFAAHLLWDLHHQIALRRPKMGEVIAFRRVFRRIPHTSAVDEADIEPLVRGQGYSLRYVPDAIAYNRGPETVRDLLKQRRRIYAGHLRIKRRQGYVVSTLGVGHILAALLHAWRWDWRYVVWTPAVAALELYGRFLGWMDCTFQLQDHAVWDVAMTTKGAIE